MRYFDPMFYICSNEMPFGIRLETTLKYKIDGDILDYAVNTAIKRFTYFSVKIEKINDNLETVPNNLPIKVFKGRLSFPLGSKEVNNHILALSYNEKTINFYITHVITDGNGFTPFLKAVLYLYLCRYLNEKLNSDGILTVDIPFLPGETENPYPEKKMMNAKPFYTLPKKEYFKLSDGEYVTNEIRTSFNFRAKMSDVMKFSHDNDASPCALFSSVMSKVIRNVHPNETKDIVSAVSFNLRPGLENANSYRMLCNAIKIRYPKLLDKYPLSKICTCTRGSITIQSQPENVLYYAKTKKAELEKFLSISGIEEKKEILSKMSLIDSVDNTFSVSYVGAVDYGSLQNHIESVRYFTDGSTFKSIFIEISSFGQWFYITLLQGFSNEIYYKTLLNELKKNGIEYNEDGSEPLGTPNIEIP